MSHTKLVTVAALALLACNKDRPTDTGAPGATAAATGTPTAPAASPTAPAASPTAAAAPNLAAPPAAVTVAVQGKPAGPVIEAGCSFDGRQLKGNEGDLFQVSCPAGCDKQDTT
ncbi:MAG TPA: hypothetical protein VFS67_11060 [Polyangiaceae bacterium]|nr:hypothetical protein [Polyangiaceae bacterium]